MRRYLARERVESGEALETARQEYRSRNRRTQARSAIPDAWRELVEKGNEELVNMLASAVESKGGVRPDDNDVAEFLAGLGRPVFVETMRVKTAPQTSPATHHPIAARGGVETTRSGKLVLQGDPTFLERCSQHPDAQGRKRRYIAQTPEELYPDREDLRDMRESLTGGWFVATNLNNVLKKTIIRLATEVAGLSFGKDVILEM
jgi:hypothetical protein